jgi:carboxymethylenebutenolidase
MGEIKTEWITLNVADGTTMRGYVVRPQDSARHTGLLVFQEAFGVNGHIRDVTERLAREGYIAVAPELFHRTGLRGRVHQFRGGHAPHKGFDRSKP